MQRLSITTSNITDYIQNRRLDAILWVRILLGLAFFEILFEHLLDANFIATTSRIFVNTAPEATPLQHTVTNFFQASGMTYHLFLIAGMALTLLYMFGLGNVMVIWLFISFEWLFRLVNTHNLYANEYAIHQFLLLLAVIEIGQGRIKINKFAPIRWKPSHISGLGIILIKWQFLLVYFMSGLAKTVSSNWDTNDVLEVVFLNKNYQPSFADALLIQFKQFAPLLIMAVKVFLMSLPAFLLIRKFRKPAMVAGALFHIFLAFKLGLFGFSFLMLSLYLLFFERKNSQVQV